MKIFAYGSNMNIERLKQRVPSATKLTNASIKNYSLTCNKISVDGSSKANIISTDNSDDVVWGVVFEIDDNEKSKLDRAEGLGNGYNQTTINVTDLNNNIHETQVYIADNNSINNELLPYDWYKQFISSGAEQNQLPDDYIEKINSTNFVIDTNEERRQTNLEIASRQP
jgi:gamma-glutamylcyclotransferase